MAGRETGDRQAEVWGRYYARSLDLMTTGAPLAEMLEDIARFAKSFVQDMLTDPNDRAIASAIVAMGHGLGLKVVAEGVEKADEAEALHRLGCDIAQGYCFAHPQPAAQLIGSHTSPMRI